MATVSSDYAVQMHGITKRFGAFYALKDMNLDVKKGSIHSLLGENGAGKSTLMNVLYGLYQADEGEIYVGGKKTDIKNPNVAIANGIGMVHQHFMLVEDFTVTQNIILGNETTSHAGVIRAGSRSGCESKRYIRGNAAARGDIKGPVPRGRAADSR